MTYSASRRSEADRFLPLKAPVLMILMVLSEQETHGYELARRIHERSDRRIKLGTGPLYRHLKRLLMDGLIDESDARPIDDRDDERRRYYGVSALGRRVLAAEAERLGRLVERIQRMGTSHEGRS